MRELILLCLLALSVVSDGKTAATLLIQEVPLGTTLRIPQANYPAVHYANGIICLLKTEGQDFEHWVIREVSLGDLAVRDVPLSRLGELADPGSHVLADFSVDRTGAIYLMSIAKPTGGHLTARLHKFDNNGTPLTSVRLDGSVEPRHWAVDDAGSLYVLGFDSGYFKGRVPANMLVHKFDLYGHKSESMSEYPVALTSPESSVGQNPEFQLFVQSLDRASLSLRKDGTLNEIRPARNQVVTINPFTAKIASLPLDPPSKEASLWRWFDLGGGTSLGLWTAKLAASGNAIHHHSVLALHDKNGRLIATSELPWKPSAPITADEDGNVYFVRGVGGLELEIVRTKIKSN